MIVSTETRNPNQNARICLAIIKQDNLIFITWVHDVNWPPFEFRYGGQFTLLTQLMKPNK